jgi:hypothetical protein
MGGIDDVCHCGGLRFDDIRKKFHKDWFRHSEVDKGDIQTQRAR